MAVVLSKSSDYLYRIKSGNNFSSTIFAQQEPVDEHFVINLYDGEFTVIGISHNREEQLRTIYDLAKEYSQLMANESGTEFVDETSKNSNSLEFRLV